MNRRSFLSAAVAAPVGIAAGVAKAAKPASVVQHTIHVDARLSESDYDAILAVVERENRRVLEQFRAIGIT